MFLYKNCLRFSYIAFGSKKYLYYLLLLFTIKCLLSHFLVKLFFFFLKTAILHILSITGLNALFYLFYFFKLFSIIFLIVSVVYFFINLRVYFSSLFRLYKLIESTRAAEFMDITKAEQIAAAAEEHLNAAFKLFSIVITAIAYIGTAHWFDNAKMVFLYKTLYNSKLF